MATRKGHSMRWVAGTFKRTADQLIAEDKDLATFNSLLNALQDKTNIKMFSVDDQDIQNIKKILTPVKPKAFVGTMKCHQVTLASNSKTLNMRRLSCFVCSHKEKCRHYHQDHYSPVVSDKPTRFILFTNVFH